MEELKLSIPIHVQILTCELEEVRFKQESLSIAYEIGSGPLQTKLPELVQTPIDCAKVFTEYTID